MNLILTSNRNWAFTIAVFLLIFVNILPILTMDLHISRLARLISVALLFVFYISRKKSKNIWVTIALSLFVGQQIFHQFYENAWGYKGYMILASLAYLAIIVECLPKFDFKQFRPWLIIVAVLLILANTYTLYIFIDALIVGLRNSSEIFLFYVKGSSVVLLLIIAVFYNNKYNSTRSLRYIFFTFCFTFSDIAVLFAYYFGFEYVYLISRLFFLIGIGLLVSYGLNSEIDREEIYEYDIVNGKS